MAEKLSWTELRRALASRAGVSEKEANTFLNALNAQIVEALKSDKQVKVNGLGMFKLQAVAPRKSVNVATGEAITIEGYNKIAFVPEASVKELVEKVGEMMDELEAIVFSGTKIDINYFIQEVLDPDEEEEIYDYFKNADNDNIKLAMEELGEDYYDEMHVRLVRLKFHCDLGN